MQQLAELLKQQAQCVCTLKQPAQQAASAKGFERLLTAAILSPGATGGCSAQGRTRTPAHMIVLRMWAVAVHPDVHPDVHPLHAHHGAWFAILAAEEHHAGQVLVLLLSSLLLLHTMCLIWLIV